MKIVEFLPRVYTLIHLNKSLQMGKSPKEARNALPSLLRGLITEDHIFNCVKDSAKQLSGFDSFQSLKNSDTKVGLASNMNSVLLKEILKNFDNDALRNLDEELIVTPDKVGVCKPNSEFFKKMEGCILIDDDKENCFVAKNSEMKTILYKSDMLTQEINNKITKWLDKDLNTPFPTPVRKRGIPQEKENYII